MKIRSTLTTQLVTIGLFCAGLLILANYVPFTDVDFTEGLSNEPILLDVAPLKQLNGTSCGEAAIVIVYNYAYPDEPLDEHEVITFASKKGYYTAGETPYTTPPTCSGSHAITPAGPPAAGYSLPIRDWLYSGKN